MAAGIGLYYITALDLDPEDSNLIKARMHACGVTSMPSGPVMFEETLVVFQVNPKPLRNYKNQRRYWYSHPSSYHFTNMK